MVCIGENDIKEFGAWIDTEEPSENTDLLELSGKNSRKRQKQEEQ